MSEPYEQQEPTTWVDAWQQPPTFLDARAELLLVREPDFVPPFLYGAVGIAIGIALFGVVMLREMRSHLNRVARIEHEHHKHDSAFPPPPDLEVDGTVRRKR